MTEQGIFPRPLEFNGRLLRAVNQAQNLSSNTLYTNIIYLAQQMIEQIFFLCHFE